MLHVHLISCHDGGLDSSTRSRNPCSLGVFLWRSSEAGSTHLLSLPFPPPAWLTCLLFLPLAYLNQCHSHFRPLSLSLLGMLGGGHFLGPTLRGGQHWQHALFPNGSNERASIQSHLAFQRGDENLPKKAGSFLDESDHGSFSFLPFDLARITSGNANTWNDGRNQASKTVAEPPCRNQPYPDPAIPRSHTQKHTCLTGLRWANHLEPLFCMCGCLAYPPPLPVTGYAIVGIDRCFTGVCR
ncbi:hypothetical protein QBC45DRAFT_37510 [Copromyces sp. CBS 386.78]|nr:hypothetical protein QBC45DRAFT_37510 [Copromyces sp. CBS 386.78]